MSTYTDICVHMRTWHMSAYADILCLHIRTHVCICALGIMSTYTDLVGNAFFLTLRRGNFADTWCSVHKLLSVGSRDLLLTSGARQEHI